VFKAIRWNSAAVSLACRQVESNRRTFPRLISTLPESLALPVARIQSAAGPNGEDEP